MPSENLPLSGLMVLDLTRARSGPTAVRQLADWGADAIRVEDPNDPDSSLGARHGSDHQNLHRNKRGITINLKSEAGKQVFYDLVKKADVVVENYRPDVKKRLGVDYDTLRAINPRIILGSISGFGQDGPYANRPGYDQIAQGMGGLMSVTGLPGQGPVRVGIPIADLTSGMYLSIGILLAVIQREKTGEGQWVHTSLLEAQIAMLDFQAARWTIDHEVPPQAGNDHPTSIPTGVFPTTDGHINIAASGNTMFQRLTKALGDPSLPENPDYATPVDRSKNRISLHKRLGELTAKRSSAENIEMLNEAGVPCGPIYSIDQTMNDPQVQHLGMTRKVTHPELGEKAVIGHAVNLSGVGGRPQVRKAAPELGADTNDVLTSIGYSADDIKKLREEGAI